MTFADWLALVSGAVKVLGAIAPAALNALQQGKSHEEALAAARAELPSAIDTRAEDEARRARVRAMHPRISLSDAIVLRRLAVSEVLTDEDKGALTRSADVLETHADA